MRMIDRQHPKRLLQWFSLTCLTLLATVAMAATTAGKTLEIVAGGDTNYTIVVAAKAAPATQHAADELSKYLEQVTGATFRIEHSPENGRPSFRIGAAAAQASQNNDTDGLGQDGYRIKSDAAGNILIFGATPRGTLYGVYQFLEKYTAIHWYSSKFQSAPQQGKLSVPAIDEKSVPRFAYREVFSRDADDAGYSAQNRLNGQFGHRIGHELGAEQGGYTAIRQLTIGQLVPKSRYGKSHPGYFAGGQRRFANPAVQRIAARHAVAQLEKWKNDPPRYLLIAHADRNTFFKGGRDGQVIAKYHADGAAFFQFVKHIAQAVKNVSPHTTVLAAGYLWSQKPPVGMPLPDNMGVMIADIGLDFSKPMSAPDNRHFLRDLDGWNKLTKHIIVWDYITDFNSYIQPFPNLNMLGPNLKLLAQRTHVEGVFEEGSYGTRGGDMAKLKAWVLAKLLWNPTLNASSLIHRFAAGYYGAAAPYIERYIALLQNSVHSHNTHLTVKTPPTADYLTSDMLQRAEGLFDHAQKAVQGSPTLLRHVKTARIPVDYAALINGHRSNSGGRSNDVRLARFSEAVKAADVTQYREGGHIKSLLKALKVPRVGPKPPAQCRQSTADCFVIQEFGLHLAGKARVVSDSKASDGAAAYMPGSTGMWGIQLPLNELLPSKGTWRIIVSARVAPGEATGKADPSALLAGVHPGKHRTVHLLAMADARYHDIKIPGTFHANSAGYVWIAPPNSRAVKNIYVDRIFAIRQSP